MHVPTIADRGDRVGRCLSVAQRMTVSPLSCFLDTQPLHAFDSGLLTRDGVCVCRTAYDRLPCLGFDTESS